MPTIDLIRRTVVGGEGEAYSVIMHRVEMLGALRAEVDEPLYNTIMSSVNKNKLT